MQTNVMKLADKLYWVGVNDYDLRRFDIIMETEFGTTYNSYLVFGSEKTALIDTVKAEFQEDFIAKVSSLVDIGKIDYVVMNHTEPDHSGAIARLLEINPELTIVATTAGLANLKEIVNRPFRSLAAKYDMVLSLGDRTLRFFMLPNLHWPDTMFSWLAEDKILFTCDFFGAHYAFEGVLARNVKAPGDYDKAMKYYFDSIMSPFKKFVLRALDRIQDLPIRYVATGHGPIVDETNLTTTKTWYRTWASAVTRPAMPEVVIAYASAYGYTTRLALAVREGIETAFAGRVSVELLDLVETKTETVIAAIEGADAFLIGSTTILGDTLPPVWDVLARLNPQIHGGKYASAFGSYGWSGEAVFHIMNRLAQLKLKSIEGLRVRFNPSVDQRQEAHAFGIRFGEFMQGKTAPEMK